VTSKPRGTAQILIIDDDEELHGVLTLALTDEGNEVRTAPTDRPPSNCWRPGCPASSCWT
jgi:hypothetical protein